MQLCKKKYISTLFLAFSLFFLPFSTVFAQSTLRCRTLSPTFEGVIDSLRTVPASFSFSLRGKPITLAYRFEAASNRLVLSDTLPNGDILRDSVQYCYRVLPASFGKPQQWATPPPIADSLQYLDMLVHLAPVTADAPSPFTLKGLGGSQIKSTGMLARSIAVGNGPAQDAVVNSSLNLQIEGELAPGMQLQATLTDRQVPFQPDGNTQQLQNFDRVLISLSTEQSKLQAGDVMLSQDSSSYFLRFFKNVQGIALNTHFIDSAQRKHAFSAGLAVARGVFQSQQIAPIESVQGPYRLRGANQERFVVVIAGSERVYLDGKQLARGIDQDYVMDYNAAELTFNNRILITQYVRIRVDFEYAVQQYGRGILMGTHTVSANCWKANIRLYQERDSPARPLLFSLDKASTDALAAAGDGFAQISSVAQAEAYTPSQVLYIEQDTVIGSRAYRFFRRALPTDQGLLSVQFTELGPNMGDYIQGNAMLNGKAYQWVPPLNGVPQGNYAPVRILPAPNQKQLGSMTLVHQSGQRGTFFVEGAWANQDKNLLSEKDDSDNQGFAMRTGYRLKQKPVSFFGGGKLSASLEGEWLHRRFLPIDRFREVEFDREWGLPVIATPATDRMVSGNIRFEKDSKRWLSYQLSRRLREGQADGWQQRAFWHWQQGRYVVQGEAMRLGAWQAQNRATWKRLDAHITRLGRRLSQGYRFTADQNQLALADSVLSTVMYFSQHLFFVETADTAQQQGKIRAEYIYRNDWLPEKGSMMPDAESHTARLWASRKRDLYSLTFLASYRQLQYQLRELPPEDNISGQVEWEQETRSRVLRSSLRLYTSSGRELKREFVMLPVDVGRGTHGWKDLNKNGLQELGEFYLAIFPDEKRFAKLFVPTDQYVLAFSPQIFWRGQFQLPASWAKHSLAWKRQVAKLSAIASWQASKKTSSGQLQQRLIPWETGRGGVLSSQQQLRWTAFFNRGQSGYGAEWQGTQSALRLLLAEGFQYQKRMEQSIVGRMAVGLLWQLRATGRRQHNQYHSDALPSQNYTIGNWAGQVEAIFQPQATWRLSGSFQRQYKRGRLLLLSQSATATFSEWNFQARHSQASGKAFGASASWKYLKYSQLATASVLEYELLEGLQPGGNLLWELSWQQPLKGGIQALFKYQGRSSGGNKPIHLGTVQIQAAF